MNTLKTVGCLFLLWAATAGAKEKDATNGTEYVQVQVFAPGRDVTFPELIPIAGPISPPEGCKQKLDGRVKLSLLVDAAGRPRYVMFIHPLVNDLDRYALRIADADRFKPGIQNGVPVAVAVSLEIGIESCVETTKDSAENKSPSLWLRALPEQKLGPPPSEPRKKTILLPLAPSEHDAAGDLSHLEHLGDKVSAPVPMNQVEAEFSDKAKNAKYQGVSLISVIVDAQGMPQDARVVRAVGMGLDQKAIDAVSRYRFKPAMKDGVPVPVMITVEVNFRL